MSGDYTRVSFDPVNAFSGVHKQQGRVSLDFEANEFEEILDRRDRAEMYDVVGQTVYPATTPDGFKILGAAPNPTIGLGRLYVDGILAECFGDMSVPTATVLDPNIGGVHGPTAVDYLKQPFFYQPGFPALLTAPGAINLVYLDVWQREVTVWEEYSLREVALNGPDTATRVQTAWQVKTLRDDAATSCTAPLLSWTALTAPSGARLTAATTPVAAAPGPCVINPAGGYTGLENRLYRVEIHSVGTTTGVGTLGGATKPQFKWSRDNASLAAKVLSIAGVSLTESIITVASTGRDAWMRFEHDDHIEFIDDDIEFAMREKGSGGPMARILSVNHATGEIHVAAGVASFPLVAPGRHPRLRRWDIATAAEPLTRPVSSGVAIPLEEGISVTFLPGPDPANPDTLHAGDYWVFAARTADGTIDSVVYAPPRGILHHFARLALVTSGAGPTDCRIPWPPPTGTGTTQEGCCTVVVPAAGPVGAIQAAIDSLPAAGGCVCLKVGDHPIAEPIRIMKSNVTLHGESIGARVISDATHRLLIVGGGDGLVTDVDVHDIHFETTGGPAEAVGEDAVISLFEVRDVAVHGCEIVVVGQVEVAGVVMRGAEQARIERNEIDDANIGVWTTDACKLIDVLDNYLRTATADALDLGAIGAWMGGLFGACRVMGNRFEGFLYGIAVLELPGVTDGDGSFVVGNRIVRKPRGADDVIWWAIDVQAFGCTIRDNVIDLASPTHGGIYATGGRSKIESNNIRSTSADEKVFPPGILIDAVDASGDDGVIRGNYLTGVQTAITVGATIGMCRRVEVLDNVIEASKPVSPVGVRLMNCADTLVSGNRILGAEEGITTRGGSSERLLNNQIGSGGHGILAEDAVALSVADNRIDDMRDFGIGALKTTKTLGVSRNRLDRCARSVKPQYPVAIVALDAFGEVVVENNNVVDTGLASEFAPVVLGIYVSAARSRIQSNQVTYTKPDKLNPGLEWRSLLLDGEDGETKLGATVNDWALILDNSFVGVGRSALVEIAARRDQMLDRVTFADNYCEHYSLERNDRGATVSVMANSTIAQGNHQKAQPRFFSFDFHGSKQVIFMGNITTGDIVPGSATKPTPPSSFNFIV